MATKAELWTQYRKIVAGIYEYWDVAGGTAVTDNMLEIIEDIQDSFAGGTHEASLASALATVRASLSSVVPQFRAAADPVVLELARVAYNSQAVAVDQALLDIYAAMEAASETVKYRNFTFGSVSYGGSNIGTGKCYRVTVDRNGHNIEGGYQNAGDLLIKCVLDRYQGRESGQEVFEITGNGNMPVDNLEWGDVPRGTTQITVADGKRNQLLTNPSFETNSGTGASLAFNGWVLDTPANYLATNTSGEYHREATNSGASYAIKFTADGTIYQSLARLSTALAINRPIIVVVRFKRLNSCDGTLTVTLGSQSEQVTLSAQTGWNDLVIGAGQKGWYDAYKQNDIRLTIDLASRTTGELLIDDIIFAFPTEYDRKYYLLTSGETDWITDDTASFSDSVANTGITQLVTAWLYARYFPHTSGTPTYADL
ncbi:hypothetical protein KC951_04095 [Candidatus Saccharibacteria bacterium]|nr:hypothetical protein [Candidatus Saccharibacteria bacterium]